MMDRPLFRIGGYILFGVVVFIVALLVTFPDGQIKKIAAVQIENQLERNTQRNFEVEISDLDIWWLGIELEGLTIQERSADEITAKLRKEAGDGEESGESGSGDGEEAGGDESLPLKFTVPSIAGRLAPISSIANGGLGVAYYLGLGGGSIDGTFVRGGGGQSVGVNINALDLNKTPLLIQFTGIPMFGTLNGHGQFTFAGNRPVLTDGNFELTGEKITIGPKQKLKIESLPFVEARVPQTNFGDLELKLSVEKTNRGQPTIKLDEFRSGGRDLQLQIWGDVELARRLANADTRLKARIRFHPDFVNSEKVIKTLLRQEKFRNGKAGDWHGLVFWGRFSKLQWKGSPTAAKGPNSNKKKGKDEKNGKKPKKEQKQKK